MKLSLLNGIKLTLLFLWLFSILLIALGCANPFASPPPTTTPPPPDPIKMGILLPLTGNDAKLGETIRSSMELAVELDNGKINGRPIKLVFEDEGDQDETIALEKAKKLVQSDKVDVIFGPLHDDSSLSVTNYTSSAPIINVKWSPLGYSQIAFRNKYTFWTSELNQSSTYPLGLYAYEKGIRSVTTLSTSVAISNDFMQGFVDGFRSKSGKVLQQQFVLPGEDDFTSYLNSLKNADAFVFSISGDTDKIALLKKYAEQGLFQKLPVFVSEIGGLSNGVMKEIGENIIGVNTIEKYLPDLNNEENRRYVQTFQDKYKEDPSPQGCEGYNAMRVVLAALKTTKGITYPDILGPILQSTQTELPTGHFQFSQNRTGMQPLRACKVVKVGDNFKIQVNKEYPPTEYYWQPYP